MTEKNAKNNVVILNPWDSQGVQITDGTGIYPCVRGCGGGGYQQGYVLQHIRKDMNYIGFTNRGFPSYTVAETVRAESHNALPCVCIESSDKE